MILVSEDVAFHIARDTMHQQQWLAVIEELGGWQSQLPVPNSFPQSEEAQEYSYAFFSTGIDGATPPEGRWSHGPSLDGKSQYSLFRNRLLGQEPKLGPPDPAGYAQREQQMGVFGSLKEKILGD